MEPTLSPTTDGAGTESAAHIEGASFSLEDKDECAMSINEVLVLQSAIDKIDDQLIQLLKQRFEHSGRIGVIKRETAQPPIDATRVQSQRERFLRQCDASGLDPEMSLRFLLAITNQVIAERFAGATQ
jgi:chorismate mutase